MTEHQHKIISAIIISSITFLGFEALNILIGLNQISLYLKTALYIFCFHIFWVAFVFDLHLKHTAPVSLTSARFSGLISQALKNRFRHFRHWPYVSHLLNYLVLPTLLYWSVVVLLYLNPFFAQFKQALVITASFTLAVLYWYMKMHISAKLEKNHDWLKVLATLKIYAVFLVYAASLGIIRYYGMSTILLFYFIAAGTFLLIYQALYSHSFHSWGLVIFSLATGTAMGFAGIWIYRIWNTEYLTAALVLLALYHAVWSFLYHHLERTFTLKLAFEYLLLTVLLISILFASHNFGTRVI